MLGLWFSGTGNTKYCVETYVKEFDPQGVCVSIEDPSWIKHICNEDIIVLGYPIYYSALPKIMHDFLHKHHNVWKGKQVFLLVTMGLFSGDGSGCAARILTKHGAKIIGGLHIKMPDCICDEKLLKKPYEQNLQLVHAASETIRKAVLKHKQGCPVQHGLSFGSHVLGLFGQRLWFAHHTKQYSSRLKIDTKNCTGCGRCMAHCPMHNIRIIDRKAVAEDHCTMCYRCVNICPAQAITLLGKKVFSQTTIDLYLKEKV